LQKEGIFNLTANTTSFGESHLLPAGPGVKEVLLGGNPFAQDRDNLQALLRLTIDL
jgi:hypothetical protein